jgi:aminoglycoside phosphotransferase family enzyme/predicted kinase
VLAELWDEGRLGVDVVETHVSTLRFTGDLVHKRKKSVRFPFVDLTAPADRGEMCRREVELNRRFSPDVYLGVEDLVDGSGRVVDHAVLMRRMPAERRLASLVQQHHDVSGCVRAVARAMAACHADAATSEAISSVARPAALLDLWERNLRELAPFVPDPLDPAMVARIGTLAHRYLAGREALLAQRIARGRIVDGHGDLLAEDIFCLDDGPRILDGLEFDDRLRWGDVLYDVGFLAMDLERLGRLDLALAFLDWYWEFSAETHPPSLEHHYIAYRALVRSKISCLRGGPTDEVEARSYLAQCQRHLLDGRVQLVVVGGLPGTGKSTLADALGDELGWPVLRSDETRKELAGLDPGTHAPAAFGEGLYSPASTDATYATLLAHARTLLMHGVSVVIDATFSRTRWRDAARALADATDTDLTEVRCLLPPDVAAARLARRAADGYDPSDATPAIATAMASEFEPWPSATGVGTLPAVDDVLPAVVDLIGAPHPRRRATIAPEELETLPVDAGPPDGMGSEEVT